MKKEKKDKHFLHKPVYPGGFKAMRQLIKEKLQYPEKAKKEKIEGTVHIRYSIDYQGNVLEAKVISGLGYGCDEEAVRLVKLLKFEVPKNRKIKVVFHKKIQIHFRLPKVKKASPEKKPSEPAPQPSTSISYQYVPQKSTVEKPAKKDENKTYSYTIRW